MIHQFPLPVVIDTNVVFEGLTQQGGIPAAIVEAWFNQMFQPYATNALAYEYADVLSRKLSPDRWLEIQPVLGSLLKTAQFVNIHYSWRPASPDPGDDHIIDCAMSVNGMIVTSNLRDFQAARESLGLQVVSPVEFIVELSK